MLVRRVGAAVLVLAVFVCASWAVVLPISSGELSITVLHTNDTHGHLLPFSYPETFEPSSPLALLPVRRDVGGIARRAAVARRIKAQMPGHVLLVDAGDFCDGTPFSTEYKGEADLEAMNAAGYDVVCPGNHEFNNSSQQVRKFASVARFPIVCANVKDSSSGRLIFRPYVIRRVGPVRVAVVGLLTEDARSYPAARDGLSVDSPLTVARRLVPRVRAEADLVVALTHLGIEQDKQLAISVPGIDVIVGGHSHTLLRTPAVMRPTGSAAARRPTIVTQDFEWGAMLGRLDLRLARNGTGGWRVARHSGKGIVITKSTQPDPRTSRVVERFWRPIRPKYGRVVGRAVRDFTQKGQDHAEYNLVADAVRESTGVQVALENVGGVRAPLVRGAITFGDVVTMDPFNNTIVTFTLSGRELQQVLERYRPAVSGIRYKVVAGHLEWAAIGGRPVRPEQDYTAAANSFFARSELLSVARDRKDTGISRLDAILRYIQRRQTIAPSYDGRRIVRRMEDEF